MKNQFFRLALISSLILLPLSMTSGTTTIISLVEDLPASIERAGLYVDRFEYLLATYQKAQAANFKNHWGGDKEDLPYVQCITKARLEAALESYHATPEQKAQIARKAQLKAEDCIRRYDAFRESVQACNIGSTQKGAELLDRLCREMFKP